MSDSKKKAIQAITEAKEKAFPQLLAFMVALAMEGERSAVVLGAERVNVGLSLMLKKFLKNPEPGKGGDCLFERDGALATFGRKTELAYRLGLMDLQFKRGLDVIRKLRNDFAHATKVESLTDQPHSNRVNDLIGLIKPGNEHHFQEFIPFFEKAELHAERAKNYLTCVMVLLMKFELVTAQLEPPVVLLPLLLEYNKRK